MMLEIIEKSLSFSQLLSFEVTAKSGQKGLPFSELDKVALHNGMYRTGPFFFSNDIAENTDKYTYYIPVNTLFEMKNPSAGVEPLSELKVDNALCVRSLGDAFKYKDGIERLQEYGEENKIEIGNRFYCVFCEFYDEVFLEVYMEKISGGDNEW